MSVSVGVGGSVQFSMGVGGSVQFRSNLHSRGAPQGNPLLDTARGIFTFTTKHQAMHENMKVGPRRAWQSGLLS